MERGMGAGGWVVLGVGLMTLGCAGAFRELPIDAADGFGDEGPSLSLLRRGGRAAVLVGESRPMSAQLIALLGPCAAETSIASDATGPAPRGVPSR